MGSKSCLSLLRCSTGNSIHAGARFQRMSQEPGGDHASGLAFRASAVWRLQPLFQPPDAPPEQQAAAQQVGSSAGYGSRRRIGTCALVGRGLHDTDANVCQ